MSYAESVETDTIQPVEHAASAGIARSSSASSPSFGPRGRERRAEASLRILLFERDEEAAHATRGLLEVVFGNRCILDWETDPGHGTDLMRENAHDVYLLGETGTAGGAVELVRTSVGSGCRAPIIVLAHDPSADLDFKALDAGAADLLPKSDLRPEVLERSIRHALVRQQSMIEALRTVDELKAEKSRLNMLRDANHRFVENACHDFRTPLTVIKEFSSIIMEGLAGDVSEEQAEFLEIVLSRVDHLSQMVDAILDASRLESDVVGVRREERTVKSLVEQLRPTLEQRAAAHKASITFDVDADMPTVFADAESVGRVIVNLVANACKFVGEGGAVRVWALQEPTSRAVRIGVTDNGPGIAPEQVKMIFERFQQIAGDKAPKEGGFGLGLHIASELTRLNFGTLSVESELGKGSTFSFTLPVFDVNRLIPLHFGFLKGSRHGFQAVSIAVATAAGPRDDQALSDTERFLSRQLRSYDLMLPIRRGTWLICAACREEQLGQITDRILGAHAQSNRNRPDGRLPELRFRTIGNWPLSERADGLYDAIRGAYALSASSVH